MRPGRKEGIHIDASSSVACKEKETMRKYIQTEWKECIWLIKGILFINHLRIYWISLIATESFSRLCFLAFCVYSANKFGRSMCLGERERERK